MFVKTLVATLSTYQYGLMDRAVSVYIHQNLKGCAEIVSNSPTWKKVVK